MLTDNENRGKEKQTVSQGPVEPAPLPAELARAGVAVQYAIFATGCHGRKACEKGLYGDDRLLSSAMDRYTQGKVPT